MSKQKLYKVTVATSGYVLAQDQASALQFRKRIIEDEDLNCEAHEVYISPNTQIDYGKKFSVPWNSRDNKTIQDIIDERTTKPTRRS